MNSESQRSLDVTKYEERALVETRKLVGSGALLVLSIVAFFLETAQVFTPLVGTEFCSIFALTAALICVSRLVLFRRQTQQLLAVGAYSRPTASPRQELKKAVATAVLLMLLLVAPLLLTRFVDPVTWIVVVTASIAGYATSDVLFAAYASYWQRHTRTVLRRYRRWTIQSDRKRALRESGIMRSNR